MTTSFIEHFALGGTDQQAVGTSAVQLPSARAKMVNIKADPSNSGNVFIGLSNGVTAGNGFALDASQETGWLPVSDVGDIWAIADAASQNVSIIWLT